MFARANNSVHVCLRCQKRLLNNIPVKSSSQLKTQSPLRRWQSNAVAKFEEEDEDEVDHKSASDKPPRITWESYPAKDKSRLSKWRPAASIGVNSFGKPAEVLILKAHDRKVLKAVYDTPDEDGPATTLQESLDSEQAPLDHTSLHRAIGDVYHKFVGNRDNPEADLTLQEYDSIKKHLTDSFTPTQMLHYLHAHTSSKEPFQKTGKHGYTRSTLMQSILTTVWNLNLPLDALEARKRANRKQSSLSYIVRDEAELDHLLTAHRQPLKEIAKKNHVNIEVFRRQRRLKVTGVNHEAQLGVQAIAKYVKQKLESIVVPFYPEYSVYADPSERDAVRAFLQRVQEKYQVHIALRKNDVKIVYYNMQSAVRAKQAAREISIVGDSRPESYEIHVLQSHGTDQVALERFPTPPEFARGILNRPWHRLLVTDTPDVPPRCTTVDTDQNSDSTTILQRLKLFLDCGDNLPLPTKRRDLRFHVTAHFGQALFRSRPAPAPRVTTNNSSILVEDLASESLGEIADITDQPWDLSIHDGIAVGDFQEPDSKTLSEILKFDSGEPIDQDDSQILDDHLSGESHVPPHSSSSIDVGKGAQNMKPTTTSNMLADPTFSCDVPYALQQLARLSPWKSPINGAQPDITAAPTQTIYRLEFICSSNPSNRRKLPVFELYVSSTARSHKSERERPSLKVLRVSAIHDQRSFYALCPRRHVDIKFKQQLKHDLTYPNNDMPHLFKKIRAAFDSYLANSKHSEQKEWSFGPYLEIAVDSSMRNVAKRCLSSVAPDQANTLEREMSVSGSNLETTENNKGNKLEYCLRRAEVVEMDSYSMPVPSAYKELKRNTLCLENITFSGAEQTRQELLLSDHSLFSTPNLKNQDLTTLVNGALGLAEYLGNNSSEHLETKVGSFVSSQSNWSDEPHTESSVGTSDSIKGKKEHPKKHHKKAIPSTLQATGHDSTKEISSPIKAKSKPKPIKNKVKKTKSKSEAISKPDVREPGITIDPVVGKESSKIKPMSDPKLKFHFEKTEPVADRTAEPNSKAEPKEKPKVRKPKQHWIGRGSVKAKAEGGRGYL
ncbi:hypothetical protein LTR84_007356 [Exophiala bonariae]|uniref:Uncharacterized protein n=1 Tax=Exophiala bonariae TaxID=1690606 RepID=A0AAV9MY12_9EURO|nr:hypothetical protein LTR84_007356 [Exophiala bonariae]